MKVLEIHSMLLFGKVVMIGKQMTHCNVSRTSIDGKAGKTSVLMIRQVR